MDTTEQINGRYFFDGMSVDGDELLFWLILDEFKKNFSGITDMVAVASMLASFPVIPVRGKLDAQKTTRGTSPLSLASRMFIRQRFQKKRRTITWKSMLRGEWEYTTSIGAYVGRWVPWIGAVLTAYDLSIITRNVVHRYNLITGEKG
ncbi:hypothetical protein BZ160_14320 [Pantoea vagans]|uniref:STM2901 family protein n=1 Tax=Enterobacter agglomerans TaxID=549 RepID=UPI0009F31471|nr:MULTISPECIES: hypothetical protein [Pantoea]OQV40454.1 hypothetical protein BZ160_14320 [Pantoea vagans]UJL36663.1 hypothetical protein JK642_16320 [Pantoea agglomerans]